MNAPTKFFKIYLLSILALSVSARGETVSDPSCTSPAFHWLPNSRVTHFTPIFDSCTTSDGQALLAIRKFVKSENTYYLLVDPETLETKITASGCTKCTPTTTSEWSNSKFLRAVNHLTEAPYPEQNDGLTHAINPVAGYFITIDLCPSSKPGFDQNMFVALERLRSQKIKPTPVGISISGGWLNRHRSSLEWLIDQANHGEIAITWINHTLTHPYDPKAPLDHNFLLERGVNIQHEILGMEKLMLENGLVPSIFFRFPGLISNEGAVESLKQFFLIPVGSDAWIAKHQMPTEGSIILIHGNENEPQGIVSFLKWLDQVPTARKDITFLNLQRAAL